MRTVKLHIKKIISIVLFTTVLLPFAIQFSHAIEKHEHLTCNDQNNVHIHDHELDCAVFHFNLNNNTIDFHSLETTHIKHKNNQSVTSSENQLISIKLYTKSSRAPPALLFI